MQSTAYLLLSLAHHPKASAETDRQGGSSHPYIRCLNTAGRWAVQGSAPAPLLVWPLSHTQQAQEAATRASAAHGRLVEVVTQVNSEWVEGHNIQLFCETYEPALGGSEALSAGKVRRLEVEVEKLEAFCLVVQAASAAVDQDALSAVSRAAAKALQAKFGGGSVTTAFAWLAGLQGQQTLDSVLAGEVELPGTLSIQKIVEAVELARQAEAIRQGAEHKGLRH